MDEIHFSTLPYIQTPAPPNDPLLAGYNQLMSGVWWIQGAQWGVVLCRLDTGLDTIKNGVGRPGSTFAPMQMEVYGDCHQSIGFLAATPDTPRWVISANMAQMCEDAPPGGGGHETQGLQVWRLTPSTITWHGFIPCNTRDLRGPVSLQGDFGYAKIVDGQWAMFNLLERSWIGNVPESAVPAFVPQLEYNGSKYSFTVATLPGKPGPSEYTLKKEEVVPEPELPKFCPDKVITRKQVCAIVYEFGQYLKGANPGMVVPEYDGSTHFRDVPDGNIFKPAIDALALAGIVAGVPDDQPC